MSNLRIAAFVLITAAFLGACVDEEDQLGSTEQAITFAVQKYLDCTTQNCVHVPLGSASEVTCFLAGVVGHINGSQVSGDVFVYINASNQWVVDAASPVQQVFTTCISAVANRVFGFSPNSQGEAVLASTSAHRRCFLAGLHQQLITSAYSNSFYVRQDRGSWYIGATKTSLLGSAIASGVCVDVPSFVGTFTISHDAPGSATQFLVASHNTNNACGLSKLNGAFEYVSSGPPYPGLRIYMLPDWVWTVSEHIGGEATCVSGTPSP